MTQTLPQVAHEHHERLLHHVNQMPEIADRLLTEPAAEVLRSTAEMSAFLTGTLIPHIDAAERTLYPELERMFQNRHSMGPMRREHAEIRALVVDFEKLTGEVDATRVTLGRTLALRRVMFKLYALLKIHLAEEVAYLRIVEHGVTAEIGDVLAAALDHPGFTRA
ncbi:MAG TPA: hemerythrin domain-containing protein [Candidatus Limnocylindrales bacterium]|nr:hemerythrin domain-containing protein [Candidatus Limnocylindrales bacterium]